tara:strand:+ start:1373 stop:1639 length:267 start_codon:yes stop_codon:yes gene_type:complete
LNRKSVHINLNESVHAEFRILAFKNKLSMQEIISGLITSLVDKDPYLEELIQKLKENKRNKELKKITNVESIDIFDEIVSGSPWKTEE